MRRFRIRGALAVADLGRQPPRGAGDAAPVTAHLPPRPRGRPVILLQPPLRPRRRPGPAARGRAARRRGTPSGHVRLSWAWPPAPQDQEQEDRGPHRGEDVTSIPHSRAAAMNQRASWDIQHLTRSAPRSTGASRRRISSARCLGVGERLSPIMASRGTRARRRGACGAGSRAWPAPPAGSPPGSSTRRAPPGATGREPRSFQRRIPRNRRTA